MQLQNTSQPQSHDWKPRFFIIWTGQAFSLIGSSLTQFVLIWWITQTTGSPKALAITSIAGLLPVAIFSPLGGAVADRFSRRLVMMVTDAITAGCVLIIISLFASGQIEVWHIYVLVFIRATMQAFQHPAITSSTVNLVPGSWLNRVAGMNQVMQGIMTIAAAPLGALILAFLPVQQAMLIDVFTAILGITPLFFFRIPQPERNDTGEQPSILADVRQGGVYIRQNRGFLVLLMVNALAVLTLFPSLSLSPLLVTKHFHGEITDVALIEGISGVGVILGGVLAGVWSLSHRKIISSIIFFSLSSATVALTAVPSRDFFVIAIVTWFISGLTYSMGNAPMIAVMQSVIPNELQGRVFSLFNMTVGLAGPIGLAIAGPIAESIGVRPVFIWSGALSMVATLCALFSRDLRNIEDHRQNPKASPASATTLDSVQT